MRHTRSQCCALCGNALGAGASKRLRGNGFGICHNCKTAGPDDEHRCKFIRGNQTKIPKVKRGKQCKKWRSKDSDYCPQHERYHS